MDGSNIWGVCEHVLVFVQCTGWVCWSHKTLMSHVLVHVGRCRHSQLMVIPALKEETWQFCTVLLSVWWLARGIPVFSLSHFSNWSFCLDIWAMSFSSYVAILLQYLPNMPVWSPCCHLELIWHWVFGMLPTVWGIVLWLVGMNYPVWQCFLEIGCIFYIATCCCHTQSRLNTRNIFLGLAPHLLPIVNCPSDWPHFAFVELLVLLCLSDIGPYHQQTQSQIFCIVGVRSLLSVKHRIHLVSWYQT